MEWFNVNLHRCLSGSQQMKIRERIWLFVALLFFFGTGSAVAADATFTWTANTEANLAGYRVYYGLSTGVYSDHVEVAKTETTVTVIGLVAGQTYYFAATAFDTDNFESDYSTEVVWTAPAANTPPVAVIQTSEIAGSPYMMEFDGSASSDADGSIVSYQWNFGDNGTGSGAVLTHTYSVAGEYSVSLTVTDDQGATSQDVVVITIAGDVANIVPTADFVADISPDNSAVADFDSIGSTDPDGDIVSYSWNFGDGEVGSGSYAQHEYLVSGIYSVTLTVMDNHGATAEKVRDVNVTVQPEDVGFALETGEIDVTGEWQWVAFAEPFINPVVVAKPASSNDLNPCVVRVKNVTVDGFEIRLQNGDYLGVEHGAEKVGFVAVESGHYELPDGTQVEAGRFVTDKMTTFGQTNFIEEFLVEPVVIASVTTVNEEEAVDGRIRKITTLGFEYRMQEQDINVQEHLQEDVSYIAWEPSVGAIGDLAFEIGKTENEVTHVLHTIVYEKGFETAPVMVADMQTTDGGDMATLRYTDLTATQMKIKVAEEQSEDLETNHTDEVVGFMVFSAITQDSDFDQDGLNTTDEREIYGTQPSQKDTDNDGLEDGAELDYWSLNWDADIDQDGLINLLDSDSDGDGYFDGFELDLGFDPGDALSFPTAPTVESGIISLNHEWKSIALSKTFVNPVVVARLVSQNGAQPCVVRLRNIDATGFDVRLQEWDYLDGSHVSESVSYIVMERGSYTLEDGTKIEAGHFDADQVGTFSSVTYAGSFNEVPVVVSSVATFNEADTVTGRMRNISTTSFEYTMQEQELNEPSHVVETISYIAWEPSSGIVDGLSYEVGKTGDTISNVYTSVELTRTFSETPAILADMQTSDGFDVAAVRCDNTRINGFDVRIEEEQSVTSETSHTAEVVGYLAVMPY